MAKGPVRQRPAPPCPRPRLGPGLKTYVINLGRRPDRRAHIEALCRDFNLDYEIVEAVDGRALSLRPGSYIEVLKSGRERPQEAAKTKAKIRGIRAPAPTAATAANSTAPVPDLDVVAQLPRPRGFGGLHQRIYRAHFEDGGKRVTQLLRMAAHRLSPTSKTAYGHELWGALGCNRSHQVAMERFLASDLDWALILEDDASLSVPMAKAKEVFDHEMLSLVTYYPDWELVYLGGHGSSASQKEPVRPISSGLVLATCVYQTHAFLVRRSLAPTFLGLLKKGFAADAALSSWSRNVGPRCFLFGPEQLLQQPGGAARWKDSDIFVQGEFYKQAAAGAEGEYAFRGEVSRKSYAPREPKSKPWRDGSCPQIGVASQRIVAALELPEFPGLDVSQARKLLFTVVPVASAPNDDMTEEERIAQREAALTDLGKILAEIRRSAAIRVRMRRAALMSAAGAVGNDWLPRLIRTTRLLQSSHWECSLSQGWPGPREHERQDLAALVECALVHCFGHAEAQTAVWEAALACEPGKRDICSQKACDDAVAALLAVSQKAAEVEEERVVMTLPEASVLLDLMSALRTAKEHLRVANETIDAQEILAIAAVAQTVAPRENPQDPSLAQVGGIVRSNTSGIATTAMFTQGDEVPQSVPTAAPLSPRLGVEATVKTVMRGLLKRRFKSNVDDDMHPRSTELAVGALEEEMLGSKRCCRLQLGHGQEAAAGSSVSVVMREQLLALSVKELRSKANEQRVPPWRIFTCLEKKDIVDLLCETANERINT